MSTAVSSALHASLTGPLLCWSLRSRCLQAVRMQRLVDLLGSGLPLFTNLYIQDVKHAPLWQHRPQRLRHSQPQQPRFHSKQVSAQLEPSACQTTGQLALSLLFAAVAGTEPAARQQPARSSQSPDRYHLTQKVSTGP